MVNFVFVLVSLVWTFTNKNTNKRRHIELLRNYKALLWYLVDKFRKYCPPVLPVCTADRPDWMEEAGSCTVELLR